MQPELQVTSNCPQETERLAQKLASYLRGGEYISLEGDLGAGKTLFSRAICKVLGVQGLVTSPTFLLQKVYETGRSPITTIVHYDFYRLQEYQELIELGFEEHDVTAIVLAEWGEKFVNYFPLPAIRIRFEGAGEDPRVITIRNAPSGI